MVWVIKLKKGFMFEPIESCYNKIEKRDNFQVFNMGIGSKKETVTFYEVVGNEAHSSIVNRKWLFSKPQYNIEEKLIEIDCLDNLIDDKINVLKIDTEGFELEVLKGSRRLLERGDIDYIQFEYGGCFKDIGIKLNDVINFLSKYNYGVYELINDEFKIIKSYQDDFRWVNFYAFKNNINNI